jgi:hypothetical protein
MELVSYYWSEKHSKVVKGIALLTLVWTDGKALISCDFRVYDKPIGGISFKTFLKRGNWTQILNYG